MKRITNRIYCDEVQGKASGEVMVRGPFTKWEIEAKVESEYEAKFGGLWDIQLGQPEQFQECPGCTIYEVIAKRVTRANDAPQPPIITPQPPTDGIETEAEHEVALAAITVANAATMASGAAMHDLEGSGKARRGLAMTGERQDNAH